MLVYVFLLGLWCCFIRLGFGCVCSLLFGCALCVFRCVGTTVMLRDCCVRWFTCLFVSLFELLLLFAYLFWILVLFVICFVGFVVACVVDLFAGLVGWFAYFLWLFLLRLCW